MNPKLQQAVNAVRSGQHKEAQYLLTQILKEDPGESQAWFLLSQLVDSEEKRLTYLKQTIALDPDHQLAAQQLAQLEAVEPVSIAEQEMAAETTTIEEVVAEELAEVDNDVMADIVVGPVEEVLDEPPTEEVKASTDESADVPIVSVPEALEPFDTLTEMLEPAPQADAAAQVTAEKIIEELTTAPLTPVAEPPSVELESHRARHVLLTRILIVLIGLAALVFIVLLFVIFTSLLA